MPADWPAYHAEWSRYTSAHALHVWPDGWTLDIETHPDPFLPKPIASGRDDYRPVGMHTIMLTRGELRHAR